MKLKALGCGSSTCRHPLVPSSFLLQSERSNVVFGCSAHTPAKLEAIGIGLQQIDIWAPLSARPDQTAGLYEVGLKSMLGQIPKPHLVGPKYLLSNLALPFPVKEAFNVVFTRTIHINEEHLEETIEFIPAYLGGEDSYALSFDQAQIFISGEAELNDEWLHRHASDARLVLHSCRFHEDEIEGMRQAPCLSELSTLPIYLQKKIWLYGYPNQYQAAEEPLPMIFLPQGQWLYDSERKAKHLEKDRFIRENGKRHIGNLRDAETK